MVKCIIYKRFTRNRKYQVFTGLDFPTEIVQMAFEGDKKKTQITTYRNVVINELENDDHYRYSIPQ